MDPFAQKPNEAMLHEEYVQLFNAERECNQAIREAEREAKDILTTRAREERDIHLVVSVYDTARNKLSDEMDKKDDDEANKIQHDYLTPFLPQPLSDRPLAREEALAARDGCLRSLKDRLVERANIIQSRLDEENAALSKKQAAFQRNRDHLDKKEEEEYEKYCSDAMFRIQILEQRLARHEEQSLQKYAEMDGRLRNDPRLTVLNTG